MPEEQQFKRNIAFKLRIGDILIGKPVLDEEKLSFLELGDKKIVRVNVIGNIVEKFDSEGEKRFSVLTLDDGSGQIKLRVFADDVEKFKDIVQGQTVLVIGLLRHFNNEVYINPEIMREQDTKYLLIRKLEREKDKIQEEPIARDQIIAVKDKILGAIKSAEDEGGIEVEKIIMSLKDVSTVIINQEIQKFLEEGIVFEPRPGKVRYLG